MINIKGEAHPHETIPLISQQKCKLRGQCQNKHKKRKAGISPSVYDLHNWKINKAIWVDECPFSLPQVFFFFFFLLFLALIHFILPM